MSLFSFVLDGVRAMLRGGRLYWTWLGGLALVFAIGVLSYIGQLRDGLVVTGMSDQVSWGFYIANFAFLVGIAAAAVLLVIPAYLFHRQDVKQVVLIGEGLAVAAVLAAMMFVLADLGSPERAWHLIPFIGRFNFTKPEIPKERLNPNMAYLGNRPRRQGVMEKCHFCVQRTRAGRYPACMEVCPVGARKFGNILDPESEVSYILREKRVFIQLKEEMGTNPRFFYYFDK